MLSGSALCVVNLSKITGIDGDYEWHLTDVRKVKPFPVKGKLNLYEVDDSLIHFPGEKIEKLEADNISLEDAFNAYSMGMAILKDCNEQIDRVEKKVLKLSEPRISQIHTRAIQKLRLHMEQYKNGTPAPPPTRGRKARR